MNKNSSPTQIKFSHSFQNKAKVIDFPFESRSGRIEFSLKDVSKIKKKCLLRSVLLFDSTLSPVRDEEIFSLPIENAHYKIYTKQRGSFDLSIRVNEKPQKSFRSIKEKHKYWILALVIHCVILLISTLYLSGFSWKTPSTETNMESVAQNQPESEDTAVQMAQSKTVPSGRISYSGFSLWNFLDAKQPKLSKEEQITSLLKNELSSAPLALNSNLRQAGPTKVPLIKFKISNQAVDILKVANSSGLDTRQKIATLSPAERSKAEAELKNKMDLAQKQMRNFYSEALRKDPSFNTRIVVTATISEKGNLEQLQASAQGHSSQQVQLAEELSLEIRKFLSGLSVPIVLAGHTVRREFIFWK